MNSQYVEILITVILVQHPISYDLVSIDILCVDSLDLKVLFSDQRATYQGYVTFSLLYMSGKVKCAELRIIPFTVM